MQTKVNTQDALKVPSHRDESIGTAPRTPREKMLASFPDSEQKSNDWYAHRDAPRFDWREREDGSIIIHSWTGRSVEEILSMGEPPLTRSALHNGKANSTTRFTAFNRASLDLFELAHYLKLDWDFLFKLGYSDGYRYVNQSTGKTYTCVKLGGYCAPDGTPHDKIKVRLSIDPQSTFRFAWDENTPGEPIPCGLHTFTDMALAQGYGIIGEGESDWLTMMFHGVPFIGIPGTGAFRSLDVSLLAGVPRVYILEEPDQVKKNQDSGQGFYKDMRSHLRANGYQGEIFSIRFKKATGQKDPSELHKACVILCQMKEEAVYKAEVKARFMQVLQEALRTALPEGNDTLGDQTSSPYVAPPPALPSDVQERERFRTELFAVPAEILSPAQKITLCVVMHSMGWFDGTAAASDFAQQEGYYHWYHVDASHLCNQAGISRESFLAHLSYLTEKLGLFHKKYVPLYYEGVDGKKACRKKLYIRPSDDVWLAYPSTYKLREAQPRKHGGLQERTEKSTAETNVQATETHCISCGATAIDRYEVEACQQCHYNHFIEIAVQPIWQTEDTDTLNSVKGNLPSALFSPQEEEEVAPTIADDLSYQLQGMQEEPGSHDLGIEELNTEDAVNSVKGNLPSILRNTNDGQLASHTVYVFNPSIEQSNAPSLLFPLHQTEEHRLPKLGIRYTDDEPQGPFLSPQRFTLCCNAVWHWNGERYVCAACELERVRA